MNLRLLCLLACFACVLTGCGPIVREMQFTNMRTGLFPMRMDLRVGSGKVDARELMKAQVYEGAIERQGVIVRYPAGMSALAERVAFAFASARDEVKARTGISWAFKPIVCLAPVSGMSGGFRLRVPLRKGRELELPLLVSPGLDPPIPPEWSRGIGHEITEASMLASLSRRELVLGDYCVWGSGLVNETRWFRDGVADYAGDILNAKLFGERYQPPPWIYTELSRVRGGLLDWSNCTGKIGPTTYYDAALGLIHELVNYSGADAVARIMQAASRERYINGSTLRRAVNRVTGLDLSEFLSGYQPVWLGADLEDTESAAADRVCLTREGNEVRIVRVHPGTPAEKWKLRPSDVILAADGHPVTSAAWLTHYLAARRPRDRVRIEFERDGRRESYLMMLVSRKT